MSINLCFDEADWERIERDWDAWWAHELDRPLVVVQGWEPDPSVNYPPLHGFISNYPMEMSVEDVIAQITPHFEATRFYGDAFPKWFVNFGPGIMAEFIGARVHSVPETVWFEPEEELHPRDIHPRHDPDNVWWRRIVDITQAAVEIWEGKVAVSHADLGGNLDIIASLLTTEKLLFYLYDEPEEIDRLVREVTELWLWYYEELDKIIRPKCRGTTPWAPIWSPRKTYMLQSDFAYMISPEMFARFVMPDLIACCDHLDDGFYHLDGKGQIVHVDQLLSMERLRGIQWIPGDGQPPADQWLDLLKRIKDAGKLQQVYVSPEGAMRIVESLGGKGFVLAVNKGMNKDEADAFLKELASRDRSLRQKSASCLST